ncbi:MAG TPA: HD domain-containing phosphohydrolase [bacterium]|jgi:HD-GYP domain-containing protein (c-di-GMP phosphodiesterase class II)
MDFSGDSLDNELLTSLTTQVTRKVKNLRTLLKVTQGISSVLDLDQLFSLVVEEAAGIFGAEKASLMVRDSGSDVLRIRAALGLPEEVMKIARVKVGQGISGTVAQSGESLFIRDIENDPRFGQKTEKKKGQKYDTNSLICVPIKGRDSQVLGVLNVNNKSSHEEFTKDDLDLLEVVAGQAGIALENARLYNTAKRQIDELTTIHEASEEILNAETTEDVLDLMGRQIRSIYPESEFGVIFVDPENLFIEFHQGSDFIKDFFNRGLDKGIIAERFKDLDEIYKRPLLSEFDNPVSVHIFDDEELDNGTLFSIPLKSPRGIVGYVDIYLKNGEEVDVSRLRVLEVIVHTAAANLENRHLYEEMGQGYNETIRALSGAIDAKDKYTIGHSERVALYCVAIGRALGFDEKTLEYVERAGILHDIGKIGVSELILGKPGRLDEHEFQEMKDHLRKSAEILKPIKFLGPAYDGLTMHHERMDGRGYMGVPGDKIPLLGRIMAIADAFDAMTSDRPYRKGLPAEIAKQELRKNSGTQFDPDLVEVFCHVLDQNMDENGRLTFDGLEEINRRSQVSFKYGKDAIHTILKPLSEEERAKHEERRKAAARRIAAASGNGEAKKDEAGVKQAGDDGTRSLSEKG